MPAGFDLDASQAPLAIVVAVGVVVLAGVLWRELRHRARRFGGGDLAAAVMFLAVAGILVALTPDLLPFEVSLVVLLVSLLAVLRPEQAVRLTGGPSARWVALREGRELQLLVRQRGGPSQALDDPEVQGRLDALGKLEDPGTEEYVGLLRETLLAEPSAPGISEKVQRMAEADAALRASLGARPSWERELDERAAGGARTGAG